MTLLKRAALAAGLAFLHHTSARTPQNPSYNGLATLPAMGWDNWNSYGCEVSEKLLLTSAQAIVDTGLRDLGYQYVILDDCWSDGRYENGSLKPDFNKFPNGMKEVADRIHDLGLKFGMYSSAGYLTCAKYEASLGKEEIDAKTFASWGVDYLKYDNCYNGGQEGTPAISYARYNTMSQALNKTGRPILYSMCNWGSDQPWAWAQTMANSWRMSGDVTDNFSRPDPRCPCTGDEEGQICVLPGFHCSILNIMNKQARIVSKTQSGAQNDMDALEVGNGGMTDDEYITQFSIWAMASTPLLMGNDVTKMSPQTISILSNPAVIAISQDPQTQSANRIWRRFVDDKDEYGQGEINLWARVLNNSDVAVALVNGGNKSRVMNASLADIFLDQGGPISDQAQMGYNVYDLWAYRMDNATSNMVLKGNATTISTNSTMRYNATTMPYAEGLKNNATALFGKMVATVSPMGRLTATVPRHGTALFRLRPNGQRMRKRDEL
ncbi:MAG: hypothetical protein MMC23_002899 [Stictis urceolatum]|nr:hypothetical protein [Stictis urceolata]